jgi:hypothetical protein
MTDKVLVTANDAGQVIGVSVNDPQWGYVRVEQAAQQISEGGWFRYVRRSALLKGLVTDLQAANFKAGDELPGRILVKESLVPFNPENPDKHKKIAGETGVSCTIGGQQIYRDTVYTVNPYDEDEFIAHDNSEDIKAVNKEIKESRGSVSDTLLKFAAANAENSGVTL